MAENPTPEMTEMERTIAALAISVRFVAEALALASPLHGRTLLGRLNAVLDQTDDPVLTTTLEGLRDCVAVSLALAAAAQSPSA